MTAKKRFFLLIIISLFCIAAINIIIFHSLGWRMDWKEKRVVQAGSFYFKAWPRNVDISITPLNNEKIAKTITRKTFFNSAYIDNLMPQNYKATIGKQGFYQWEKTLEIKERAVTESRNIILVKQNPYFYSIGERTKDFYASPDERKIIYLKAIEKDLLEVRLLDLSKNEDALLMVLADKISNIAFYPDSKRAVLETEKNIFVMNLEDFSTYAFAPRGKIILDQEYVFFLENNILTKEKPEDPNLEPEIISENVISAAVSGNNLFYLDSSGAFFKQNREKEILNKIPLETDPVSEYKIIFAGFRIFLTKNKEVYLLDEEKKEFVFFLDSVEQIIPSPDNEKILFLSNNEIKILFLKNQNYQPQRQKNELLFLFRASLQIEDAFWWTNHYLIFNTNEKITIIELDNRDRLNSYDLAYYAKPKIFWSNANKKLFLVSEESFYMSESLILF